MKQWIWMASFIGGSIILLPLFILYIKGVPIGGNKSQPNRDIEITRPKQNQDIIEEEVLVGILAKEIPYTYEKEALKAQAVVERTYMARRILGIQAKGGIVGYTHEEMVRLWGDNYDKIYHLYQQAVEETKGEIIFYENKPIEAVYHRASSGRTRDAKVVYGVDIPYLKGVESKEDGIRKQVVYSKKEVKERLQAVYKDLSLETAHLEDQIQIVAKDEAGYVTVLQIGNVTMEGKDFYKLMELPSCAFKIYASKEQLIIDVRGIGNGVGMSQNGANELARQGENYKQIIHTYYTGVTLSKYEVQK